MKKICLRFFVCLTILGGITLSGCIINVDTGDGTIRVYNNTASVDITYAELLDEDGDMVKEAEGIKAGKSLIFTDIKSGSYTVYIETSDNRVYESDSLLLRNGEEKDFDFT
ncbi:MAG: hypothetical protein LBU99_04875, partial [Spirochaetaceae bacterium]|nr:hypothetical protein [Spirochaetaceae bacterium]